MTFFWKSLSSTALALIAATLLSSAFTPATVVIAPDPPAIDDLVGSWELKSSENYENIATGERGTDKIQGLLVITMIDATTIRITDNVTLESSDATYMNGYVVLAGADLPILANESQVSLLTVSGKPGKLKMKGDGLATDLATNQIYRCKFSLKQLAKN